MLGLGITQHVLMLDRIPLRMTFELQIKKLLRIVTYGSALAAYHLWLRDELICSHWLHHDPHEARILEVIFDYLSACACWGNFIHEITCILARNFSGVGGKAITPTIINGNCHLAFRWFENMKQDIEIAICMCVCSNFLVSFYDVFKLVGGPSTSYGFVSIC